MIVDPETFVGEVVSDLTRSAPTAFTAQVLFNKRLQNALLALRTAAVDGLRRKLGEGLLPILRARKTDVIAALMDDQFTVEKLLGQAIDRVMVEARKT